LEKHGDLVVKVNPKETSTTCPACGSKMISNGYRKIRCSNCDFEENRGVVTVLNIEKRALEKWEEPYPLRPSAYGGCKPGIDAGNR
jgi:transposase